MNVPTRLARVPPHIVLFGLYNVVYLLPLFLVFLWGYSQGSAADMIAMDARTMIRIAVVYAAGLGAFLLGTLPVKLALLSKARQESKTPAVLRSLKMSDGLLIVSICLVFVASKIALIPTGVYHQYAFDTGQMVGGTWSFSMFCSETLAFIAMMVLMSNIRHNVLGFVMLTALNGISLLHGSRIFFIISVLTTVFYLYTRGHLSMRRILVGGPLALAAVLLFTYLVFLSRSQASLTDSFSGLAVLSPIVYESLFSQLSVVALLKNPDLWDATGHALRLLSDTLTTSAPRLMLPDKDDLLYLNKFAEISPLGAMNGYAAGLIYFGLFFPIFYFFLGLTAQWLYIKSRRGRMWAVFYAYFTADFLFRVMRDGYLIPLKMMINTVELALVFIALRILFAALRPDRVVSDSRSMSSEAG